TLLDRLEVHLSGAGANNSRLGAAHLIPDGFAEQAEIARPGRPIHRRARDRQVLAGARHRDVEHALLLFALASPRFLGDEDSRKAPPPTDAEPRHTRRPILQHARIALAALIRHAVAAGEHDDGKLEPLGFMYAEQPDRVEIFLGERALGFFVDPQHSGFQPRDDALETAERLAAHDFGLE